jgi:hypothetical protein
MGENYSFQEMIGIPDSLNLHMPVWRPIPGSIPWFLEVIGTSLPSGWNWIFRASGTNEAGQLGTVLLQTIGRVYH